MEYKKFEFVIVLRPDEIEDFTQLLKDNCKEKCIYWGIDDGPTKTTLTVKLSFYEWRTLRNVERWLASMFPNMKDKILSVKIADRDRDWFAPRRPPCYRGRRSGYLKREFMG